MVSKLQIFVLDRATGQAVPGVPVSLELEVVDYRNDATDNSDDKQQTVRHRVGILQSDHAGYLSYDVSSYPAELERHQVSVQAVWLYPLFDESQAVDILSDVSERDGGVLIPLKINVASLPARLPLGMFPSVPNPTAADWKVSPNSFGTQTTAIIGDDGCEVLLPSTVPTRIDRYTQIIPTPTEQIQELDMIVPTGNCEPDPRGGEFDEREQLCYRMGKLVEYQTVWQPINHGLGQILYSLTLAPCESTNIAVIDWARQDTAARREDQELTEHLVHDLRRDRTIEEIVDATVKEWQKGRSFIGGTAGVGGYGGNQSGQSGGEGSEGGGASSASSGLSSFGSLWSVTGSHALGLGKASTRGEREVEAETTQQLMETISQASNASRRLRGTVIVQASQTERERLETRTVTNHNHCHALSILYYEILRHYCVTTRAAREKDVIFISYQDRLIENFDLATIREHRQILVDTLLSDSLDLLQK